MIYPSADKLDATGSKYSLVIVAAKRSRQVKEGARVYVHTASTNPITIALEEIASGEITSVFVGEPERMPTSVAPTPVLTGLVSTSIDDDDMPSADAVSLAELLSDTAYGIDGGADDDELHVEVDLDDEDPILQSTEDTQTLDEDDEGLDLNNEE